MKSVLNRALQVGRVSLAIVGLALCGCGGRSGTSSIASAELTRGLIHWWQFNGNGNDSAGSLSTTPIGPVSYTQSPTGQGIVLNGTTTAVSLPAQGDVQFQGSYSISAWAYLNAYTTTSIWSTIIFDGDDRPGLDPYFIQVAPNGSLVFQTCGAQSSCGLTATAQFPLNQWVHVTGTYDQARGVEALYVNGLPDVVVYQVPNLTPVVALDPNALPGLGIGVNNGFPNSVYDMGWNGVISDVRIYNRAITPAEVHAIYEEGAQNVPRLSRSHR